jgi:uncharacterized phage-associated protein
MKVTYKQIKEDYDKIKIRPRISIIEWINGNSISKKINAKLNRVFDENKND